MRRFTILLAIIFLMGMFPGDLLGADLRGLVKLGYVFVDEEAGDLSVIQESYNLYEDFSISKLKLEGSFTPNSSKLGTSIQMS